MKTILKPLPHDTYSPDMDMLILYVMDGLGASGEWTAGILQREYGKEITRNAVISRRRKLRLRGLTFKGATEE